MKIIISNSSERPIYEQILMQIKSQIINGEMQEGDPLPSIRGLAKELGISVITTKRAYEELEKEGYIDTVTGKGSFVAKQKEDFLKEKKLKIVEEKLSDAVNNAVTMGISYREISDMLKILMEEE